MFWLVLLMVEVVGLVYAPSPSSAPLSPHRIALGRLSDALLYDPPDKIRTAYEAYLAEYPGDMKTRMKFAGFLEKQSQPTAALVQYQAVSRQEPRNVDALKGLARCHTVLGQHDLATLNLEEACRIRPDDAALLKELGLACHRAGDPARALDALHRSLAADPNQQDLFPLIAQITQGKAARNEPAGAPRRVAELSPIPAPSPLGGPHAPVPSVPRPVDPARYGLGRNRTGP